MTTPPKRLTAEEVKLQDILQHIDECLRHGAQDFLSNREVATLVAALRQRDELYRLAWEECEDMREREPIGPRTNPGIVHAREAHDAARRAAGLED